MKFVAHSARPECGIPAQSYSAHVENVRRDATKYAQAAAVYSNRYGIALQAGAGLAGEYHDLGKLDLSNQAVLSHGIGKLPINHVDAGAAYLLRAETYINTFAALLVHAHHRGLPAIPTEQARGARFLRDEKIHELTEKRLADYERTHRAIVSQADSLPSKLKWPGVTPQVVRIALSCLVDADHSDTASHYGYPLPSVPAPLYATASARLSSLDRYVKNLSSGKGESRASVRNGIYNACREASTSVSMYACDSPVGTGKTTAVMAHLLQAVAAKGLRRIFVVLPYTNIIDQSVDVYRRSITLPGENSNEIVAAHHHRVQFEDWRSRQYSLLWHAPFVVTTAVQFFETLASSQTAALRKFHQVAGSAIFIDEAHAALPSYLWPQGWKWLKELVQEWGCHVVLGSGTLSRFWELEDFNQPPENLPELVSKEIRVGGAAAEAGRVRYRTAEQPLTLQELITWIQSWPGPRLLILNTVQSAAVVAKEMGNRSQVEHLSTALSPVDRTTMLHRVKDRLMDAQDKDWTLVATSCVEAGVDLSFRTCFRERCSLVSLVQTGGRGNRSGEYGQSDVWDFQLVYGDGLREHPAFRTSGRILGEMFDEGLVLAEQCREALRREIRQEGMRAEADAILRAERNQDFPSVEEDFAVIDSKTITVVVDEVVQDRLEEGLLVLSEELHAHSVQIWGYRKDEWAVVESKRYPGIFFWKLGYDSFLGYMKGVLEVAKFKQGTMEPL